MNKITTIEDYIAQYSEEEQMKLNKIRKIIQKEIPEYKEKISWGMPSFYERTIVISFAQAKNHIGIYPGPAAIKNFEEDLKGFKTSKGTIQIQSKDDVPETLIKKIVKYNLKMQKGEL